MDHTGRCNEIHNENQGKRIVHYNLPPELAANCDCVCHSGKDLTLFPFWISSENEILCA